MNNTDLQLSKALEQLRKPGALASCLEARHKNLKRIYVMGCGRSGTWLLTGIMTTFADVSVLYEEVPVEYFGLLSSDRGAMVLKRNAQAYETVEIIPPQIAILFIVRHPFDVLTSLHPQSRSTRGRSYYITSGRWLGETMALKWLVESGRPRTKILRYEDLVNDPNSTQADIASFAELQVQTPVTEFYRVFKPSQAVIKTMYGLRPPEPSSIGRWKTNPDAVAYLKTIRLRLSDCLPWIESTFGYDMRLDHS